MALLGIAWRTQISSLENKCVACLELKYYYFIHRHFEESDGILNKLDMEFLFCHDHFRASPLTANHSQGEKTKQYRAISHFVRTLNN